MVRTLSRTCLVANCARQEEALAVAVGYGTDNASFVLGA